MRILFVTANLPYPPHQGGALRSYGLLQGLHQAGHQLSLLSFGDAVHNITNTPLDEFCDQIITVEPPNRSKKDRLIDLLTTRSADIAKRLYSERFAKKITELALSEAFDLIQFEGIEVACYLPVLRSAGVTAKLVYDAFNAEAAMQYAIYEIDRSSPGRWVVAVYSLIQSRRIKAFEQLLCQQAELVIAVSAEDAALLQELNPKHPIPVVANGIFASEYDKPSPDLSLGQHTLVFTGKMDYRPNVDAVVWFTKTILPKIKQHIDDVKFYVVGQKPHETLESLRDNPSVIVTGWVESVLPYLKAADVYVAPLRMGSGTRLKILEAMSAGCAVVATTLAASGMQRDADMGLIIVDNPNEIASTIVKLINSPALRSELGQAAHKYVQNHYDWSVLIPNLLKAYETIERG